jgi:dipeptidyl aminopeptidase/acylaminoacyl peptidase
VQKPFSYIVPASSFGSKEEIWDLTGKSLAELSSRKLSAGDTGDTPPAAQDRRRGLAWRPDGAGLSYVAPLEEPRAAPTAPGGEDDEQGGRGGRGGQTGAPTGPRKEKLVLWSAPFGKDDIKTVYQSDTGIGSVQYSADGKSIYVTETVSGTETLYKVDVTAPSARKNVYSYRPTPTAGGGGPGGGGGGGAPQAPSNSPGTLVTTDGPLGRPVVREAGSSVFLRGTQQPTDPEKEGPRPFLDKVDLDAGKTTRLWQGPADAYETLNSFLDAEGSRLLVDRQSATQPNNTHIFENGALGRMLTENKDHAPDITEAKRYRIRVTRADGFKFWVRVTVPKWHMPGQKLPAMFWFYPGEFTDQAAYDRGQRNQNKNLFPNVGNTSMALLTRLGYAFVDPDCPIVGPAGRMNDYYVNDLRNNLSATIDELERQGLIDRTKLAIGGHSYGGFSTANAMVHTPFFKAGIAGAGNYNRTLTPMSFQTESRSIHEARQTYLDMSSMLFAENMTGALLMYCGMLDQNVGTDPINSVRMFNVLESIGKPAALYMYPYEDHGQVAKETLQDMWARWIAWLDKYVEPREKKG